MLEAIAPRIRSTEAEVLKAAGRPASITERLSARDLAGFVLLSATGHAIYRNHAAKRHCY